MTTIHHLNCGTMLVPSYPTVVCHCLLLEEGDQLALVDTGIGLADVCDPVGRLGQPLIDMAGFQFHEADTAVRRIEAKGLVAKRDVAGGLVTGGDIREAVRNVVLTHGDPDHAGGLADFPNARIHVSTEELAQIAAGNGRYVASQFAHGPHWTTYPASGHRWFGLEARPLELGFSSEVLLIPLFGHTLGHCGVAIRTDGKWLLHVGDAYYLRAELTQADHPVSQLAALRADDDAQRRASLEQLRRLVRDHGDEVELVGYHDITELPAGYPLPRAE